MGLKASKGAYGCSSCHDVLDWRAPRPPWLSFDALQALFDDAVEETETKLRQKGLLP